MGQCKCIQTAIYKGVPKAVGGKENNQQKTYHQILGLENERPLKCIFFLIGKWH